MKRLVLAAAAALLIAAAVIARAGAETTVGHSGWNWGNPQPQGHTLHAVEFAGGRGYAVGEFGTLLRTDDGGATWKGVPTGTTFDLTRLRAVDANSVVIGSGCLLRRSDDGGASFRRLLFTSSEASCPATIASFHFPAPQVGYLLLSDGSVVQTGNGGSSFSGRQAVPGTQATRPTATAATPTDIFFTDATTGFALTKGPDGGAIYRTSDGGNTWFRQATDPQALSSVFFADPMVGYAVGAANTVLKTTDGGMTWKPQHVPENLAANDLTSIRCVTANSCLMSTASGDRLLRTTDGGTTTIAFNPSARKVFAASYASASVAVGVGERGATVRSSDAGAADPSFAPIGSEPLDGSFSRLRAPSDSIALAPGENGRLAISTDGARNWDVVRVPTSDNLVDGWFTDATHGFVLDLAGKAQRTDDGGASWALLDSGTNQTPSAIYAPDASTVLLFGPRNVRRSQDGGTSFEPVAAKLANRAGVFDFDRTSGGVLFAYGTGGVIVSSNVGASWKAVKGPVKHPSYQKVDFVSETTGFALTADGRVWRTATGGRKWAQVTSTGTNRAYDMSFSSASDGYLAIRSFGGAGTDSGWLLRTSDGGVSWRPQLLDNLPVGPRGLATPVAGTAFALAGPSDLLYTNTGGDRGAESVLSIAAKPATIGRKARTVKLTGRLAPAAAGATVVVSARRQGAATWSVVDTPRVSSSGTFTSSIRVRATTDLVAQWYGDAAHDGDGSTTLVIKRVVKKQKRGR
jgi:photosystem II stability/assembly factor-like uncharacterized protein